MNDYIAYKFQIGKEFRQKSPESVEEYLETALQIHGFLEQHKVETEDGIYWADDPTQENVDFSFTHGSSGVAFFYLELYKVTKDETYRELAVRGADYIGKHLKNPDGHSHTYGIAPLGNSLYHGLAGIGMCFYHIYLALKRQEDLDTIKVITDKILNNAVRREGAVFWTTDASMLLDGGVVVYLYKISQLLKDPAILETARQATDTILAGAIKDPRGGLAWDSHAHAGATRVPNFECGTAGVGYALTVAYEYTHKEEYLHAAVEAAKHLKAIAVPHGEGFLIPWHDEANETPIFYGSTCHGAAGTSKLFYQLYKLTGDKGYLDDVTKLYRGIRYLGVPERQSAGYWNTTCLCCGTAGIVQFLIGYYLITKDEGAKKVAITAGNILLGEQKKQPGGHAASWPVAFERIKPDAITENVAYWTGSTGVAGALIQLYLFLTGQYKWDKMFDDPYPGEAAG